MALTYDDGILNIYDTKNIADPGMKPVVGLYLRDRHYFSFEDIGITRYYTAMQAKQQIAAVVSVPGWQRISVGDICALEDGKQYRIVMCQPTLNDDMLREMKLSLERIDDEYVIKDTDHT